MLIVSPRNDWIVGRFTRDQRKVCGLVGAFFFFFAGSLIDNFIVAKVARGESVSVRSKKISWKEKYAATFQLHGEAPEARSILEKRYDTADKAPGEHSFRTMPA